MTIRQFPSGYPSHPWGNEWNVINLSLSWISSQSPTQPTEGSQLTGHLPNLLQPPWGWGCGLIQGPIHIQSCVGTTSAIAVPFHIPNFYASRKVTSCVGLLILSRYRSVIRKKGSADTTHECEREQKQQHSGTFVSCLLAHACVQQVVWSCQLDKTNC